MKIQELTELEFDVMMTALRRYGVQLQAEVEKYKGHASERACQAEVDACFGLRNRLRTERG